MKTPDETVAEKVGAIFEKQGLILSAKTSNFISNLASGKLRVDDWSLYADLAIEKDKDSNEKKN
ncbi:MAG: hypothetical protein ACD_79C01402G0007 [uncultured bacterium]|nr:MAG: hypothetical protein ACD_79C01402G0007 [uncultured bacterium]